MKAPHGSFRGIFWGGLFATFFMAPVCLGGFVVGVHFVTVPTYSPLISVFPLENFFPYSFTGPASPFAQEHALDGISESQLQAAITHDVQHSFRTAEINMPGRMLNVDIRLGPVSPVVGTTHLIGAGFAPTTLFGTSYATGATFRPDLRPDTVYTNELSLTFADSISTLPQLDPSLHFNTLAGVVHAIAGTAAHEIGHTLNVWNHDPGQRVRGYFPLMASGETSLPLSARLEERRFQNVPNTQYQFPGPPSGGPLIYSTTDTLVRAAGTTWVSDFNYDLRLDTSDEAIWRGSRFQEGTGVKQGDADDDGRTDVRDYAILKAQSLGFGYDAQNTLNSRVFYDPASGQMFVDTTSLEVVSLRILGPQAISTQDPFSATAGIEWETAYFAGAQQWYGLSAMDLGGRVLLGTWASGLGMGDFGSVEIGSLLAGRLLTSVSIVPEPLVSPLIIGVLMVLWARQRAARLEGLIKSEIFLNESLVKPV